MSKPNKRKKDEFDKLSEQYASEADRLKKEFDDEGFSYVVPHEVNRDSYRFLTSCFGYFLLLSSLVVLVSSIYVFSSSEVSTFVTMTDGDVFPIKQFESVEGAVHSVRK